MILWFSDTVVFLLWCLIAFAYRSVIWTLLQQFSLLLHFSVVWSWHREQLSLLFFPGVWGKGGRFFWRGSRWPLRVHLWAAEGARLSPGLPVWATQPSAEPSVVRNGSWCCPCRWVLAPLGMEPQLQRKSPTPMAGTVAALALPDMGEASRSFSQKPPL